MGKPCPDCKGTGVSGGIPDFEGDRHVPAVAATAWRLLT